MKLCHLFFTALLASPLFAVQTVTNTNDSGAGSLRQAIADAATSDTIEFSTSLNGGVIRLTSGALVVNKFLNFNADNLSNGITLDAGGNSRIVTSTSNAALTFRHFVFLNGNAGSGNGGAVFIGGADTGVQFFDCYFENNEAQRGGAVYRASGDNSLSLRFERSTFRGNSALTRGGAIEAETGSLTVEGCTLFENHVGLSAGPVDVANGGALYLGPDVQGRIVSSTFTDNLVLTSFGNGGAVFKDAGSSGEIVEIEHCTVVGNRAPNAGGGLFCDNLGEQGLALENSCVALNEATFDPDLRGDYEPLFGGFALNFVGEVGTATNTGSRIMTGSGAELTGSGDPLLSPLGDFGGPTLTMMPLQGSQLIDKVSSRLGVDQRLTATSANFRKNDLGAIESGPAIVVNTLSDETSDASTTSLREALAAAALTLPASRIIFDAAVFDGSSCFPSEIELTQGPLVPVALQASGATPRSYPGIFIDGSSVDAPVVLRAGSSQSIATVSSGTTLAGHQLTLSGGSGSAGGAVAITTNASLSLTDSTVRGNSSTGTGGALHNNGGAIVLNRCTLFSNQAASNGGALYNDSQRSRLGRFSQLSHCTFVGNSSVGGASAIHNQDGLLEIRNCTVTGNFANTLGAVSSWGDNVTETVSQSNIIAGNEGGDLNLFSSTANNSFTTLDFNLIGLRGPGGAADPMPAFDATGDTVGNTDPRLAPLADYGGPTWTSPPLFGSAAIDPTGALPATSPLGDQRGGGVANRADSGAVQSPAAVMVTNANDSGAGSLRAAIDAIDGIDTVGSLIHFDPTVFNGEAADKIELTSSLFIDGNGLTLIDASNLSQKVEIGTGAFYAFSVFPDDEDSVASFHNLSLDGGLASQSGGVLNEQTVVIDSCQIEGMRANFGSAVRNSDAATMLASSLVSNQSANGGTVSNNGDFRVEQSTFSENRDTSSNGGTLINNGCLIVANSTFAHNRSASGGAAMRLNNNSSARLCSTTISRNVGNSGTGGISIASSAVAQLDNCIVAGNSASATTSQNINGNITGENNVVDLEPILLPLGNYGGPSQTMPPLSASPAIDLGSRTELVLDQRGYPRTVDALDAGAVEAQPALTVTSAADSGSGSLRERLTGTLVPGQRILFDPALFEEEAPAIELQSAISVTAENIILEASLQPCNILLDVSAATGQKVFINSTGSRFVAQGLDITGGTATGNGGGAVTNSGTLTLVDCYLYGNSSNQGGAILNFDELLLHNCTFADNSCLSSGGAIINFTNDTIVAKGCTFTNNSAGNSGGAIATNSGATFDFSFCTFTENTGSVGGIFITGTPRLFLLENSILAGNSNSQTNGTFTGSSNLLTGDPLLVPLGYYGGRTPTRPPTPDSPAIDSGSLRQFVTTTTDQRGAPRATDSTPSNFSGFTDAGAAEYQPLLVTFRNDSGFGTLRRALEAPFGSSITFNPSSFTAAASTITLTSGTLEMERSYLVDASALSAPVILRNISDFRILEVGPKASVAFKNFEFRDGEVFEDGGAIFNRGSLTLEDCVFENNRLQLLTGGLVLPGSPGSMGHNGGAIYSDSGSALVLERCRLNGNSAGDGGDGAPGSATPGGDGGMGGAIYGENCRITMRDCYLHDNQTGIAGQPGPGGAQASDGNGGALAGDNIELLVQRSTFAANSSVARGGGVYLEGGDAGFVATTFTANQAFEGAACFVDDGRCNFFSNTISGNTANGGFSSGLTATEVSDVEVANSIIAGNFNPTVDLSTAEAFPTMSPFESLGHNLYGQGNSRATASFDQPTDLFTLDPLLAALADYGGPTPTTPPLRNSPALDAGGSLEGPAGDLGQRGFSRPFSGQAEIGAVEVPAITAANLSDLDENGVPDQLEGVEGLFPRRVTDPRNPTDTDGDGYTDAREIELGTNPLDSTSLLQIRSIVVDETTVTLEYTTFPGLSYRIEQDPSPEFLGFEFSSFQTATGPVTTRTVSRQSTDLRYFYRIEPN